MADADQLSSPFFDGVESACQNCGGSDCPCGDNCQCPRTPLRAGDGDGEVITSPQSGSYQGW